MAIFARKVLQRLLPSPFNRLPLVDEAVRLMTEKNIKRLPILDPAGKFKGMLSRDALLRLGVSVHPGGTQAP